MTIDVRQLQSDPRAFRRSLRIVTDSGEVPLGDVIEPWQSRDFNRLDLGWRKCIGQSTGRRIVVSRGWLERPRGHSKTSDIAAMVTWALFASRRPVRGVCAAVDRDQSKLLLDAIERLLVANPWLSKVLDLQSWKVVNRFTGAQLDIIAADASSSYGLLLDFCVLDEVAHWGKRDLFDSLMSSVAKRKNCLLLAITNAGFTDSWQHELRERVRVDDDWIFSRLDGPQASWISESILAEQQRLLPNVAFRRLWLNEWSSGGGDALPEELINDAFDSAHRPHTSARKGYTYVAGLDLGIVRDCSALVVLAVNRGHSDHGRIELAMTRIWRPSSKRKVDLQDVEQCILETHSRFGLKSLSVDPWECRHMASRLQAGGLTAPWTPKTNLKSRRISVIEIAPTGQNLQKQATSLLEAFNDRRIRLFDDPDLRRDLPRLRVEERSYGFRLTSPHDEFGHGDMASALQLALLAAVEVAGRRVHTVGSFDSAGDLSPLARAVRQLDRRREYEDLISQLPTYEGCPLIERR